MSFFNRREISDIEFLSVLEGRLNQIKPIVAKYKLQYERGGCEDRDKLELIHLESKLFQHKQQIKKILNAGSQ